ncbi:MAG: acyl--CoA ligase [Elusimicrobia bacterium]|nr:acyl--CoA ligase [Elusimicrobiota bacterium]
MKANAPAPLAASVFETAARRPGRDALICGRERVSYGELAVRVRAQAAFLKSRGVVRGDRVILAASGASPAFVCAYLACHATGAVAVPVDPKAGALTLDAVAASTRPRLTFLAYEGLSRAAAGDPEPVSVSLDDTADILFTGGTTGAPKGVMQTHANIRAFAQGRNNAVGCTEEDRLALPLPLSHGFGLGRLRATLLCGATVILIDGFADCEEVVGALGRGEASGLCCVPAGFALLFSRLGDRLGDHRDRLRYIETATAPLPDSLRERLSRLLPKTRLFNSYGLTETTSSIAYEDLSASPSGPISVGRPIPGVELRIVDSGGRDARPGEVGRVLVRGGGVMRGYWGDPSRTREAVVDGWYASNDLGTLGDDGRLFLKGRIEDVINVGGLKVFPAEIEGVLRTHPAVADCACVGAADPAGLTGEAARAFLVPAGDQRPAAGELVEFLRGRLEGWKIPFEFVWVDELPKTAAGKVRRARLKELGPEAEDEAAVLKLLRGVRRLAD